MTEPGAGLSPDFTDFHPLLQKKAIAKEFYNLRER
jgi:hypothetical protein